MVDSNTLSLGEYREKLREFDAAVCDAIAVGQASAQRFEMPAVGYSTHVFARVCAHAQALICAAPKSRWVKREFEIWDVSAIASHARSILEGYLLFRYLADAPSDLDTQRAYVQVMHLYDCLKRIKILPYVLPDAEINAMKEQAEQIRDRLNNIPYFISLEPKLKNDLLDGRFIMITPRKELLARLNIKQDEFDFFWNYLSQYTHVLSFTFYRIEPNGRGTGIENEFDRRALYMVLDLCTQLLTEAVDRLVEIFPDTESARRGLNSVFSPGPVRNLPKRLKKKTKKK